MRLIQNLMLHECISIVSSERGFPVISRQIVLYYSPRKLPDKVITEKAYIIMSHSWKDYFKPPNLGSGLI